MLRKEDFEPNMETEDKIPGAQTENPAQSQRFGDFIVKYMQNVQNTMELFPGTSFQAINEIFGVLYVPLENMGELEVTGTSYNSIPKCYTYMDMEAAGASGITRLHDHPYLKLRGKGTAVELIIRMQCFEMQAVPGSLIYGISRWKMRRGWAKTKSKMSLDGSWNLKMEM